jgi:phenylalanyl-tRNA synthetase beta chain
MKVSYNWLKELLDFSATPKEVAHLLTISGTEVEGIEEKGFELNGIVTAKILEVKPHPDADKLTLCLVDNGTEKLSVVCGAPNAKPGLTVFFAGLGAIVAGGLTLKKAKIRGIESNGMILAEDEIGISADHAGIIELPNDIKPGTPLEQILNPKDYIFELEITPNRPDCLSHFGIARELKALLGGQIKYPKIQLDEIEPPAAKDLTIEIADSDGCPRYTGRLVSGVKVQPSPLWLKMRLHYLGIRPINNIVDITNYVQLETGHPLHGFDYGYFKSKKVVIRKASAGEKFVTLDGVERTLNDRHLLITDGKEAVALAGIMGGRNSEVAGSTTQILLESAYFEPVTIRYGAKAVGLSTESSQRFERGADPEMAPRANDRACQLIAEIAGGKIHKGIVDSYPKKFKPVIIDFRPQRANAVLGVAIDNPTMKKIFDGLDIKCSGGDMLQVTQPSFRPDLTREIDLIEEIARIYGLDNIVESYRPGGSLAKGVSIALNTKDRLRHFLVGMGFIETFPLTLIDGQQMRKIDESAKTLTLQNPLSEEMGTLRPDLIISMLKTLRHNINHGNKDLMLFDIGTTYNPSNDILPNEKEMICLAMSGRERPISWRHKDILCDIYSLKGMLEEIFDQFKIGQLNLIPQSTRYFDNDYSFALSDGHNILGYMGKLSNAVAKTVGIKQEAFIAELDFEIFCDLANRQNQFRQLPKFPGSDRDIALVLNDNIPAKQITELIVNIGGKMVEDVFPFDLFKGKNIPEGKKSIAFRIHYRSSERTLTDTEVDEINGRIVAELQQELGAVLRS